MHIISTIFFLKHPGQGHDKPVYYLPTRNLVFFTNFADEIPNPPTQDELNKLT